MWAGLPGYVWAIIGAATVALGKFLASLIKRKWKVTSTDGEEIKGIKANCKKYQERHDRTLNNLGGEITRLNEALPVILSSMYALLVTAEKGKANGEITNAKKEFTDAFKQKFYIK